MNGNTPIAPRNGHTLVVGIVARISGCANQKELSLKDQEDHAKEIVAATYSGSVEYTVIATKGKGERLDRPELGEVERLLRSRQLDLLICEDLGRLVRGVEASWLCGIAVDHGTRVLAPNDCVDTAEDSWEEDVLSACRDHVGHNAHTSKRLKHKLMNRFLKFGGAMAREIYGYIVPDDATTYQDWRKDPSAEPIIKEAAERLRTTLNCSAVADWLNGEGAPVGPYCRRENWDGKMVRRYFQNPLLKGLPGRGFKHTVKHNETGRRVSVKNPKGAKFREAPHLAFFEPDEFDELVDLLREKNRMNGRKAVNGRDPLLGRTRKRTSFPGQHARCWYCGRQYVWGGNGMAGNLMCTGAREWRCWNSISFSGAIARQGVIDAITSKLYQLDGFENQFAEMIRSAAKDVSGGLSQRWGELLRAEEKLKREREKVKAALKALGAHSTIQESLAELDACEKGLALERRQLERHQARPLDLPTSIASLREVLAHEFERQAAESAEFGDLLRKLVPEFHVYLVRLCDGGHLFPRAKIRLNLAASFDDAARVPGLCKLLSQELAIDLFCPPQRERIRVDAAQLAVQGLTQREIARRLPEKPTSTAVGDALALQRLMESRGLASPYIVVSETPVDYPKLRRQKNSKFRFTPLDGYDRPKL